MSQVIKQARAGKNAETATDPNDFIFHSDYNTLKIIASGLYEPTIPANTPSTEYKVAHNLEQIPFVIAFMREASLNEVVLANNFSPSSSSYLEFSSINADYTDLIFKIANNHPTNGIVAHIRYLIFEIPL